MTAPMGPDEHDVIVVGGGPTGFMMGVTRSDAPSSRF